MASAPTRADVRWPDSRHYASSAGAEIHRAALRQRFTECRANFVAVDGQARGRAWSGQQAPTANPT